VQNTMYRHLDAISKRMPHNPLWIHPDDLAALGVTAGERVSIESAHGRIEAVAEADATLRRGVVSITHGWGGLPDDAPTQGVNVNRITSTRADLDPINAMPRLTALPVRVQRAHPLTRPET
jgi:anaerobic selenocysteine-containing dehydrogenase